MILYYHPLDKYIKDIFGKLKGLKGLILTRYITDDENILYLLIYICIS